MQSYRLLNEVVGVLKGLKAGSLFYDAFSVTRLYSVNDRAVTEWR
jgi:hypothetical protein